MALKKQLRTEFLARRAALSEADYSQLNQGLLKQFQTLDFNGINYLHIFLPMLKRREPDTTLLIDWLQQQHPEIQLAYPRVDMTTSALTSYLQDEHLVLEANTWGIKEPVIGTLINPDMIDMVIVPMLAFDTRGYRVGYGKGFYDRFLSRCKPGTRIIGISQFAPVDAIDDVDEYDIPLQQCIMPDNIWTAQIY